jgi:hypothetical protein
MILIANDLSAERETPIEFGGVVRAYFSRSGQSLEASVVVVLLEYYWG